MTIDELWLASREKIVPRGMSMQQLREMKRCFVAGAWAALNADDSDENRIAMMDQCVEFRKKVSDGKA